MRSHGLAIVAAVLLPIAPASGDPFFSNQTFLILSGGGRFGTSVARAGDVNADGFDDVIVGAPQFSVNSSPQGAAFVYHGRPFGMPSGSVTTADTQLTGGQAGPEFGYSVAGAGDVNGDGYDDVIVGAPLHDAGQGAWGAAFIFLGGPSGVAAGNASGAATRLLANKLGAFGWSVAGAGDVNGDGYDDVIVGAPKHSAGQPSEGVAFIYLGSAAGIPDGGPLTASARIEGNDVGANLGVSVAGAGDVNGDGYDDVIVGSDFVTATVFDQGGAFVFLGSASGIASGSPATAAAALLSDQTQASFGFSVGSAGDVDGDGYDDVIVGAPLYDAGTSNNGAAFIFEGSASGIASGDASSAATRLEGGVAGRLFGYAVDGIGDVNTDGFGDVIVGTPWDERAFVYLGSASGIPSGGVGSAAGQMKPTPSAVDADFGASVAGMGDVDGDGVDDVIVGGPAFPGTGGVGRAFVFRSGSDAPESEPPPVPALAPLALAVLVASIAVAAVARLRRRAS